MTADKFSGGMHHNVCPMLNGTDKERCAERIVNEERYMMSVSHFCHAADIRHLRVGITESLGKHHFRFRTDGGIKRIKVVYGDNGVGDSHCSQRMYNQVIRPSIQVVSRHDMVAWAEDVLQGIGYRRSTGCHGQRSYAAFQGCHTGFEHSLCVIGKTSVDISCIAQSKTVGRMLCITEDIRSGLVNGHGTCTGCRVRLLLTCVQLQCFKVKSFFIHILLSFVPCKGIKYR